MSEEKKTKKTSRKKKTVIAEEVTEETLEQPQPVESEPEEIESPEEIKPAKTKNLSGKRGLGEYLTLDEIKQNFQSKSENGEDVYQKDVLDAVKHLDMTDDELDELLSWFSDEDIELLNDSDEVIIEDDFEED